MPSDAPSPDALDAAKWEEVKREMIPIGLTPSERRAYWNGYDSATRAAVRRLAEQGEVYVTSGWWTSETGKVEVILPADKFPRGTKVRVTRIEEAP